MIVPVYSLVQTSRRARLTAAHGALFASALAAACSSPLTTRRGEALVVTTQGTPIAGAVVRADPIDPHHPLNISDYFRDEPGSLGTWRTDANGRAAVTLLRDRPTAVSFTAPGYAPDSTLIDSSELPSLRLILSPVLSETGNVR